MENKLKLSEIMAAASEGKIEQDIPATFFLVTAGDGGDSLLSCSSIHPKTDADLAKRWIALAAIGLLKGCLEVNPKAWEALAYWKTVNHHQEAKKEDLKELEDFIAAMKCDNQKGENA